MNPLPPFHVFHDFLPECERRALLEMTLANEAHFVPTTVFHTGKNQVDPEKRISSKLPILGPIEDRLSAALREASPAIFERVGVRPFAIHEIEVELVAHNDGAHFAKHRDTFTGDYRQHRKEGDPASRLVSGVYYFFSEPKRFSGGELRLHPFGPTDGDGPRIDILPEQNSLAAFPSFALHEVLPVRCPSRRFADSRFAVNFWFYKAG